MQIRKKWVAVALGAALMIPAAAAILDSVLPSRTYNIKTQRLVAAAASQPNFTREQRLAVHAEIAESLHPHWKTLSLTQRLARYAMFAKIMMRPRDAATPPAAPFVGNQTLIQDLSSDLIGLQRESDCSLTLHKGNYTLSSTMSPTMQFTSSMPNYERVLHNAAGLTTPAGAFTGGCQDPSLGQGTRRAARLGSVQGKQWIAWEGYSQSQGTNGLNYLLVDPASTAVQDSSADFSLPNLTAVTSGDLNGDGIADVVGVDVQNGRIAVWLAHADGTLPAATLYTVPGVTAESAVVADVNGDGKLDVVVASSDGYVNGQEHISVLTGNGDGTLNAPQSFDVSTPTSGNTKIPVASMIAADIRGIGHPDIVGGNGLVLLNNGSGTFTVGSLAFPGQIATSNFGPNLTAGDFNGDGKLDLAVTDGIEVRIFVGQGDGTFTAGKSYAITSAVGYISAADLDGDGHVDLYLGLASGGTFGGDQYEPGQGYALMGNGDGTFQGAPSLPFSYTGTNLADLNDDGIMDAVGVNADGSFTSYLGDGHGNFATGATLAAGTVTISGTAYILGSVDSYALGDINGDGKADLAFISQNFVGPGFGPGIFIALGDGQGGFAAPSFYAAPSTVGQIDSQFLISNLHLADLDRDGKADLLYNYTDSSAGNPSTLYFGTIVQRSNGDGTFKTPQTIVYRTAAYSSSGINPQETSMVALVTDLNKDGKPDLVFVAQSATLDFTLSTYTSGIQVALGNGDGSFAAPVAVAGPDLMVAAYSHTAPPSVTVGDMNGDGIPDLIALGSSTTYTEQVAVALGVGDGTFRAPVKQAYSAQYLNTGQGLAVGDFNADGKLDVAITDPYSSIGAGISLGNGDGTLQTTGGTGLVVPSLGINVQADGGAIAYDFNGDGVADILAGNTLLLSQASGTQTTPPGTADFGLTASATSGSVSAGQTAQLTLTVTPTGGFDQSVSFACSGLPASATCSFAPGSVTPTGGAATSTLTITTTARTAMNLPGRLGPWLPGSTLLAGLVVPVVRRRRRWFLYGVLVVALAAGAGLSGCHDQGSNGDGSASSGATNGGSTGGSSAGTPAGTSTVTITATAGSIAHSITYTLTVS